MSLDRALVLNRFISALLGLDRFEDLRRVLRDQEEGPGPDGLSRYFHVLAGLSGSSLTRQSLEQYDHRILDYEATLARNRRADRFRTFKYFQYLALLYTEIFLDRLSSSPDVLLRGLNEFRGGRAEFKFIPPFEPEDLRRLAFFMATGSGKTLLLHVHIWQVLHYLKVAKHPEAMVKRPDGRREFDNILLITPGEGLSNQHLQELEDSGLDAGRFDREASGGLFGPRVQVIEIHKLVEERSGDGVSVGIGELGSRNLVIVDEGHKGTGSEAKAWKTRQKLLSEDGFLLEYSATFEQAIGAVPTRAREELLSEYGKAILFDYSYRYFYGDDYGKTFRVLNLKKASSNKAHELMVGGLLVFYQQTMLFKRHAKELRPYNLEKPLWVLLGTSVSRKRPNEKDSSAAAKEERTDVAEVVAFLQRFLEHQDWAVRCIAKIISGKSGFVEIEGESDLFERHVKYLNEKDASGLYKQLCRELFHGQGALEVVEIKQSGEIGLRVSASSAEASPYFALINIGDVPDFRKHLEDALHISTEEDVFNDALFDKISQPASPINLLVGAKKFIEGWSSWRVSSMGLLRIGKGEGSQVIQLFGRGVRLKGKDKSLKRSYANAGVPEWLEALETLYIVGWNADYLQTFREILAREDLGQELPPLYVKQKPIPKWALVPQMPSNFDTSSETWELEPKGPRVVLNLLPELVSLGPSSAGVSEQAARAGKATTLSAGDVPYCELIGWDELFAELLEYKNARGYENVFVRRESLRDIAEFCEIRMSAEDAKDPELLQRAATRALKTYMDKYVRLQEREVESIHAQPGPLVRERQVIREYRITIQAEDDGKRLLKEIESLIHKPIEDLLADGGEPLPRLYLDWHLFNPMILEGDKRWREFVTISPPALVKSEKKLVEDLRQFWADHQNDTKYRDCEVCLLRNLPKKGVGIFVRSGFYPDFILWIRNRLTKQVRVLLLDPHGLHHEGIEGNERLEAIERLRELGKNSPFVRKKLVLDGYILAPPGSVLESIPGVGSRSWNDLERDFPLLRQDGEYVEKLFQASP